MTSSRITFKMVLLGEGAVGKTAIRERFLGRGFKGKYIMTLGADFALKRIALDDTMYVTQIWDLAGQSGFTSTRKLYYGGAMAGLLVFDINNPDSFEKLDLWINEIRNNIGELIPLVLIGNKSDLRGKFDDQVPSEKAKSYALHLSRIIGYRVPYIETSALDGSNIEIAFETLIGNVAGIIAGDEPTYDPDNVDDSVDIIANECQDSSRNSEIEEKFEVDRSNHDETDEESAGLWNIPQVIKPHHSTPIEETEKELVDPETNEVDQVYRQNLFPTKVKTKRQIRKNSNLRNQKFRRRQMGEK